MSKPSRTLSPALLEEAALSYLARYAATVRSLRRVLTRKIDRLAESGEEREKALIWVDQLIERHRAAGHLDDCAFAERKGLVLLAQGRSPRAVSGMLAARGVSRGDIAAARTRWTEDLGDPDLTAARALVRRRRLGVHRDAADRQAFRLKDLQILARAGFSRAVAVKALDGEDEG